MSDQARDLDRRTFTKLTLGTMAATFCGCNERPGARSDGGLLDMLVDAFGKPKSDSSSTSDDSFASDDSATSDSSSCVAVWQAIPAQTWYVGVPVHFDLALYVVDEEQLSSVTYGLEGNLPAGLSLNGSVISGTPSAEDETQLVATANTAC